MNGIESGCDDGVTQQRFLRHVLSFRRVSAPASDGASASMAEGSTVQPGEPESSPTT